MGDMADDLFFRQLRFREKDDYLFERELQRNIHRQFRDSEWTTKTGEKIKIKDMEDLHLLNAYKMSGNENLFKEMVVRLFENNIKGN